MRKTYRGNILSYNVMASLYKMTLLRAEQGLSLETRSRIRKFEEYVMTSHTLENADVSKTFNSKRKLVS